jgi:hypothetical protein
VHLQGHKELQRAILARASSNVPLQHVWPHKQDHRVNTNPVRESLGRGQATVMCVAATDIVQCNALQPLGHQKHPILAKTTNHGPWHCQINLYNYRTSELH